MENTEPLWVVGWAAGVSGHNPTLSWMGYLIRIYPKHGIYWAYAPGGGCLYAAGYDLAEAKKFCYEHLKNKPIELP